MININVNRVTRVHHRQIGEFLFSGIKMRFANHFHGLIIGIANGLQLPFHAGQISSATDVSEELIFGVQHLKADTTKAVGFLHYEILKGEDLLFLSASKRRKVVVS